MTRKKKMTTTKTPKRPSSGERKRRVHPKRVTLGARKRQLSSTIESVLIGAYPKEAMSIGQWLIEMGHQVVLTEIDVVSDNDLRDQFDRDFFNREIPPERLN
jgi:hypothetical protein